MPVKNLLIPVRQCTAQRGRFALPEAAILASPSSGDTLPLSQLAADLAPLGVRARVARSAWGPAAVRLRRDKAVAGAEAYRLAISPAGIEIAASADAGAYYAVQTLRELLAVHGRALPACTIDDAPDFGRRGVYLDCSRGKVPTVATLKALVERLARWKINELQLYVENVFTFRRHPAIGRGYSPFTPEELLDVQGDETLLVLVCRVAPAESDFVAGQRDEPVVGDANPVRVAAEVAQSVFRSAEGTL